MQRHSNTFATLYCQERKLERFIKEHTHSEVIGWLANWEQYSPAWTDLWLPVLAADSASVRQPGRWWRRKWWRKRGRSLETQWSRGGSSHVTWTPWEGANWRQGPAWGHFCAESIETVCGLLFKNLHSVQNYQYISYFLQSIRCLRLVSSGGVHYRH